jgi:hypothetical protein
MQTVLLICIALGVAGASICLAIKLSLNQHGSDSRRMGDAKK